MSRFSDDWELDFKPNWELAAQGELDQQLGNPLQPVGRVSSKACKMVRNKLCWC